MKKLLSILGILFSLFTGINFFSKELFGLNFIIKIYEVISTNIMKDTIVQLIEFIFNIIIICGGLIAIFCLFYLTIQEIYENTF